MGLMNTIKALGRKWLGKDTPPSAGANLPDSDLSRYSHVSKPITEDVALATKLGLPVLASQLLRKQKGVTLYTAKGSVKREADKLAKQLGLKNAARIALRSKMVRRLGELQAAA